MFEAERQVNQLNEGHVRVICGSVEYDKGDGEKTEVIEYSIKSIAREVEQLVCSIINTHAILPLHVKRIDVTTRGDYGQGSLQHGVQVTVVTTEEMALECSDDDDKHAITVESIFAEVI